MHRSVAEFESDIFPVRQVCNNATVQAQLEIRLAYTVFQDSDIATCPKAQLRTLPKES